MFGLKKKNIILSAFLVLALVATTRVFGDAEIEEEEDVLVLTDDNFEDAIKTHNPLLVEFYAPWCGHCKSLAPEYAKAAKALKEQEPAYRIAKLDATANNKAAEKFGIQGFPTLKFFKGDASKDGAKEYDGGRTSEDIVKWINKKSGPSVKIIETEDELKKLQDAHDVVVFAVIDKAEGTHRDLLEKVADADDVSVYAASTSTKLSKDATKPGSVVLHKKFDDKKVVYTGKFEKEGLVSWVKANNKPLVIHFSQEKASQIFGGDIDVHLLMFSDETKEYQDKLVEAAKVAATTHKGKILHVVIPASESRIVDYFGLKEEDLPSIVLVNMGGGMKKFPYKSKADKLIADIDGTLKDDLVKFEKSYLDGKLKPTLKSAEPFDDKDENVKVISGKEFEERVINNKKDVLLEFYAPWCGHCKSLAPKYDELAENFADVESIMIAKMDATENEIDHPKVDVKGFPTIFFFPGNDKANPVQYDGARDVDGFTQFLKKHATKFTLNGESHGVDHDEL